jgi:hypothetical protein
MTACPGVADVTVAPDLGPGGLRFPDGGNTGTDGGHAWLPERDGGPGDGAPGVALDGPNSADHGPAQAPDLGPVKVKPDAQATASCSAFSAYTCQAIPPVITCSSMCQAGDTTLGIACYEVTGSCSCIKGLTMVGTCAFSGSACTACQNAYACCAAMF